MINEYASDIASKMGLKLSKVHIIDGKIVGCTDSHRLMMASRGCNVSTVVYLSDIELINNGGRSDKLDLRIQQALLRLQHMIEL